MSAGLALVIGLVLIACGAGLPGRLGDCVLLVGGAVIGFIALDLTSEVIHV